MEDYYPKQLYKSIGYPDINATAMHCMSTKFGVDNSSLFLVRVRTWRYEHSFEVKIHGTSFPGDKSVTCRQLVANLSLTFP